MQIRTGTCEVTNNNNKVIASADANWTDVVVGALFISGDPAHKVIYYVNAIINPATSGSGRWEVTLSANYAGATNAAQTYSISVDFTPLYGIPLINAGDVDTAMLFSRAMAKIEETISGL